jgi:hypothetical protein
MDGRGGLQLEVVDEVKRVVCEHMLCYMLLSCYFG